MNRTRTLLGLLPILGAPWLATPRAHAALLGRGGGSGRPIVPAQGKASAASATATHAQSGGLTTNRSVPVAHTRQIVHTQVSALPAHVHRIAHAAVHTVTTKAHTGVPLHLPSYSPLVSTPQGALDGGAMLLLAGKFGVVLVLLFVCLRVLRAVMPGMRGDGKRGGAMVLHSEPIGDKQRVCLLDLQDRLVLVGISATGMTALTTIEDVEQVAMLRERYSAKPVAIAREEAAPAGPSFAATLAAAALAAARSSHNRTVRPFAPMGKSLNKDLPPASTPRTSRWGTGAARADAQAEHNPSLDRALEAMRAVRQKLASPFDPLGKS